MSQKLPGDEISGFLPVDPPAKVENSDLVAG